MNQYTFRLCGIQKEYDQRRVLHIHELDIYPHEMLAVVGPSGAGKSTLLRLLNFLEPPSEGAIEFKGHVVDSSTRVSTDVRRQITTVFQRPLLVRGSVIKNVLLGLRFRGNPDGDEMAMLALEQVGMQSMATRRALDLSGGEMQRVALARSIILEPKVLLLDEPTANLDPANVRSFEQSLHRIKEQEKTTIVLVTHNLFQARRLADRVALLVDGNLIEVNQRDGFFDSPATELARSFIHGEMVY